MVSTQLEIGQAIQNLEQKISKIREKVAEIDEQIKSTSVNNVEKVETELEQLKNRYYETQARELIGEFDEKQKKQIEEDIQVAERRLKSDNDRLQNLVGIRQALEIEFRKSQTSVEQHQAALERLEFESLKVDRQKIVDEISFIRKQLENIFQKVSDYNLNSVSLVTRILNREHELRGYPTDKTNGSAKERIHQLAEPFDMNLVKSSLTEALSDVLNRISTN